MKTVEKRHGVEEQVGADLPEMLMRAPEIGKGRFTEHVSSLSTIELIARPVQSSLCDGAFCDNR